MMSLARLEALQVLLMPLAENDIDSNPTAEGSLGRAYRRS